MLKQKTLALPRFAGKASVLSAACHTTAESRAKRHGVKINRDSAGELNTRLFSVFLFSTFFFGWFFLWRSVLLRLLRGPDNV